MTIQTIDHKAPTDPEYEQLENVLAFFLTTVMPKFTDSNLTYPLIRSYIPTPKDCFNLLISLQVSFYICPPLNTKYAEYLIYLLLLAKKYEKTKNTASFKMIPFFTIANMQL